jgi:hypothetical protein
VPPFELLGTQVPAGETRTLSWFAGQDYAGIGNAAPVLVAHDSRPDACSA